MKTLHKKGIKSVLTTGAHYKSQPSFLRHLNEFMQGIDTQAAVNFIFIDKIFANFPVEEPSVIEYRMKTVVGVPDYA